MKREPHFLDEFIEEIKKTQAYKDLPDKSEPWYNKDGDCIMYIWSNEDTIGDWLNERITVFRSPRERSIIGFAVYGISAIMGEGEG